MEVCFLRVRHELIQKSPSVRNLPLFGHISVLNSWSELILIGLNEAADLCDVERVWILLTLKVIRQLHLLTSAFWTASMQRHRANTVHLLHIQRDHDRRDDLVADFWLIFHGADNDVYGVPSATLHSRSLVHLFLDEEASIEALRFCVIKVDRRGCKVVVELDVLRENFVCLLL